MDLNLSGSYLCTLLALKTGPLLMYIVGTRLVRGFYSVHC